MSASADTDFSLAAGLEQEIEELTLGQSAQASVIGSSEASDGQATAAGFVFTAPEAGEYTFWSEGNEDTYGILCDIELINPDTCLLHNNRAESGSLSAVDSGGPGDGDNFAIIYSLSKGQTVYLKSMCWYDDQSISFTVHVGRGSQSWNN